MLVCPACEFEFHQNPDGKGKVTCDNCGLYFLERLGKPENVDQSERLPDAEDPRLMTDDRLKTVFRRTMRDIADGDHSDHTYALCGEAEQQLRRRGFDPKEVASRELANMDDEGT